MKNIENHPYILLQKAINEKTKALLPGGHVHVDVLILGKTEYNLITQVSFDEITILDNFLRENEIQRPSGITGWPLCLVDAESEFIATFLGDDNLIDVWKSVKEKYPNTPFVDEKIAQLVGYEKE